MAQNKEPKLIELTNPNTKDKLFFITQQIFAFWYSTQHRSTIISAVGGALIPVTESVEEVTRLLSETENG